MALIHVKEFLGGLDVRRMAETTPGGVLVEAVNCHITAGGEAESRAAFVEAYTLPSGTIGLAATRSQLVTFGNDAAPTMPSGVVHQRLQHPSAGPLLVRTPSWDLYAGLVYVVGVFSDGSRHHFYNVARVTDWFDGRARASFSVVSGNDTTPSKIDDITINGVSVIGSAINYATDNSVTAAAIAAEITSNLSTPEYTAISVGDTVVITASSAGTEANGRIVAITTADGFVVSPASGLTMSGGATTAGTFTPGAYVETIGSKMNSLSGPNWHFSGIREPTKWTTDAVGAGFVDLSTYSSGSEELVAIATYQDNVAIFSETNVQIWFSDPDPALNTRTQILNNTGTAAANSVTQFGDSDIFYLNESGIRSLRARDSSNAASTSDIGVPIDDLVTEALAGISVIDRDKIFGLIEPRDGRFWMIIGDTVYVLSYFRAERTVSAWTTYTLPGSIEAAVVFNRKVWLRVGNKVYVYGGTGADRTYDDTECVVRTPFLDADNPTQLKYLRGIDVAAEGEWEAYVSMDVNNPDVQELVGIFKDSTFLDGRIPANGSTSHFSFTFKSRGTGPHKLGSLIVHFAVDQSAKNES